MQLSLRLSFYLRCSLRDYTVASTMKFQVKIVVAIESRGRAHNST
jgi:hypothetical protein